MTSPVSDLLVQESLCTELFRTISESVEASNNESPDLPSVHYSDDVIGQLLDQMIQILPPEERNILGCTIEKNIDEIMQEANELIRATTPLFSSSDSGEKSWNISSKAFSKTLKTDEHSNSKDWSEEKSGKSVKAKSESDSICSSLESIVVKENMSNITPADDVLTEARSEIAMVSEMERESDQNTPEKERDNPLNAVVTQSIEAEKTVTAESLKVLEVVSNKMDQTSTDKDKNKSTKENLKTLSGKDDVQPKTIEIKDDDSNKFMEQIASTYKRDCNSQLEAVRQKYTAEIQELKLSHNKEVYGLKKHITGLNDKIYEYQKRSEAEISPESKNRQLELFENELKSQEQLIAGYERENQKLCKEIAALKEIWKQRENKLNEEKQRLQNELQGMVSKSTTEALEEQLKDARETIVKLQIELTTYKSKNKELELASERLRIESQRLQTELSNCHCDRTVGRRDKYSFLASSNVGLQIQELKNVISRKDAEIAQMNTTLGIMKGELSNRDFSVPPMYSQQLETHSLSISQMQTTLAVERQGAKDVAKEKELLMKENLDLKRQVRELETIVKRRQRTDSCVVPVSVNEAHTNARLAELEKELSSRQESLAALHTQFLDMQKKYEDHIQDLEKRLKESKEEVQTLKVNRKKEDTNSMRTNFKKLQKGPVVAKEETHLLATIRGLRQEAVTREKEINKLNKEVEEVRQTNKRLQKEREKQLNSMPNKMSSIREKANLRKVEKANNLTDSRPSTTSPNNNVNPLLFTELQESNIILKSKTKSLQEEVKKLEQDLIAMHNKRVHDLNVLQSDHDLEMARLMEERAALLSQSSATELQGQVYTQQMVINHLKNRLKQMEELKNEVMLLRAERDHLEESLAAVNKKMCYLQNAQSPESIQYKTLLAKLEMLEKNQEIREQKLNAVRELLSRSTQGQGQCSGTCRDKLLDKNRQICYYRAQMDRILEALLEIRRTK